MTVTPETQQKAAGQGSRRVAPRQARQVVSPMDGEVCYGVKLSMNYGCHIFFNTSQTGYCWLYHVISLYSHDIAIISSFFPVKSHLFYMFRRGDSQWRRLFGPRTKIRRVRLQKKKEEDSYLTMEKTRWSYDV